MINPGIPGWSAFQKICYFGKGTRNQMCWVHLVGWLGQESKPQTAPRSRAVLEPQSARWGCRMHLARGVAQLAPPLDVAFQSHGGRVLNRVLGCFAFPLKLLNVDPSHQIFEFPRSFSLPIFCVLLSRFLASCFVFVLFCVWINGPVCLHLPHVSPHCFEQLSTGACVWDNHGSIETWDAQAWTSMGSLKFEASNFLDNLVTAICTHLVLRSANIVLYQLAGPITRREDDTAASFSSLTSSRRVIGPASW